MGSKVISFRVPDDLYEEFERKCKDEGTGTASRLKGFVENQCHPPEKDIRDKKPVKTIEVEKEKLEVVKDTIKKSWFPLDFSLLFGEGK